MTGAVYFGSGYLSRSCTRFLGIPLDHTVPHEENVFVFVVGVPSVDLRGMLGIKQLL